MNILRAKVALVGDPRVGKTCIVSQLIKQYFNNTYQTTLGTDYNVYETKIKDSSFNMQLHILDFTGFSIFRDLLSSEIKDVNFIVYVYDATNVESFQNIKLWKENVKEFLANKKVIEILVANKTDLKNKVVVQDSTASTFASSSNMKMFNCSAVNIF